VPTVLLTGSIATDELMRFPGKFADLIVEAQLDRLSLSFLCDDLQFRRGGTGANIAFGMGALGTRPVLVGSAGRDFDGNGYRGWLDDHGVDTSRVRLSATAHTARFVSTTDEANCQIASFYSGAMREAREIELDLTGIDMVCVSPDDVPAMVRHTEAAHAAGVPLLADIGQQLAHLSDRDTIRRLVDRAAYVFVNDYEKTLLEQKSGWSDAEVLDRVGIRVTTMGADGAVAESRDGTRVHVTAPPERSKDDPTGAGDALRAGFLAAWTWGLGLERCLQVGSVCAVLALETVGPQEYDVREVGARLAEAYGAAVAAEVSPHLPVQVTAG